MLFVGGVLNGHEIDVMPGQQSYVGRIGAEVSHYSRRPFLAYGLNRGRQAMVEISLSDTRASMFVMETLLSRWATGGTDDERA